MHFSSGGEDITGGRAVHPAAALIATRRIESLGQCKAAEEISVARVTRQVSLASVAASAAI